MKDDAKIAAIGRELAAALSAASYERGEDEMRHQGYQLTRLMVELCAAVRAEMITVITGGED